MNCEDFRRELETAVENRAAPDFSEAREHLKRCRHCRALCEDYDVIERAVAEWTGAEVDAPDLSGRVLAVLANERATGRLLQPARSPFRPLPVLLGLSAVALLFLAFFFYRGPDQNPANFAKSPSEFEDEVNIEHDPIEMEHVLSDTRAAYASLVRHVTGPFEPFADEIPPAVSGDENSGSLRKLPEERASSDPPHLAGLQSEVMKPLGFLTAVLPSPSAKP